MEEKEYAKRRIACSAWFPANGKPFPRLFKFKDDNGEIQTVKNISVHRIETKNQLSCPVNEYDCRAIIGGLMREFKIVYRLKSAEWYVSF
ncbi:MAG: hypothetical protein HFE83_08905 [Lachnospiraceae bacterium]|nr:hypothetical protein [Lachnospiraceae bacterium]